MSGNRFLRVRLTTFNERNLEFDILLQLYNRKMGARIEEIVVDRLAYDKTYLIKKLVKEGYIKNIFDPQVGDYRFILSKMGEKLIYGFLSLIKEEVIAGADTVDKLIEAFVKRGILIGGKSILSQETRFRNFKKVLNKAIKILETEGEVFYRGEFLVANILSSKYRETVRGTPSQKVEIKKDYECPFCGALLRNSRPIEFYSHQRNHFKIAVKVVNGKDIYVKLKTDIEIDYCDYLIFNRIILNVPPSYRIGEHRYAVPFNDIMQYNGILYYKVSVSPRFLNALKSSRDPPVKAGAIGVMRGNHEIWLVRIDRAEHLLRGKDFEYYDEGMQILDNEIIFFDPAKMSEMTVGDLKARIKALEKELNIKLGEVNYLKGRLFEYKVKNAFIRMGFQPHEIFERYKPPFLGKEFDIYAERIDAINRKLIVVVAECKNTLQPVNEDHLKIFLDKVGILEQYLAKRCSSEGLALSLKKCFFSRGGYTEEAMKLASKARCILYDEEARKLKVGKQKDE